MKDEIKAKQICKDYHSRYCFDECKWFGNCLDQQIGDNISETDAICSSCGRVLPRVIMFTTNTGRSKQHLCPKCYKKGMSDSGKFTFGRVQTYKRQKGE